MLKVFLGKDQIKIRQQAHLAIEDGMAEGKEFVRLEPDNYEEGMLLNVSSAVSLFNPGTVYLVDSPAASDIFYTDFLTQVEELASSTNYFVVILEDLNAADKKKITKYAAVVEEYKKTADTKFNPFQMADALAVKDKRTLWLFLQEAKQNGLAAEEIIGTLWWQLKSMRLASVTKSPEEAGMKDYPYRKAKSALNTFRLPDVEQKSRDLLKLYHEGHRGKRDLDLALEEWVLRL